MARGSELGSIPHLARRFFGALSPAGPPPADESWATGLLLPGERQLWRAMSGPDRRHAVRVARDTLRLLDDGGPPPGRAVMAAALLHDVGKVVSGLGTLARAAVTAVALVVGRSRLAGQPGQPDQPDQPDQLSEAGPFGADTPGRLTWRRRVECYFRHDRIGADLLRRAGSDQVTVAWAEEHHLPSDRWTVDRRLADALKAADGD